MSACYSTYGTPLPSHLPATSFECTDSFELPVLDTIVTAVAVAVPARSLYRMNTGDADYSDLGIVIWLGVPLAFAAMGAGYSAIAGYAGVTACRRSTLEGHAQQARLATRRKHRERAWQVTKGAAESARAGDCAAVAQRQHEVRDLDLEFHDSVFVRDVAIHSCLTANANAAAHGAELEPEIPPR
jgi:hypothetical protein